MTVADNAEQKVQDVLAGQVLSAGMRDVLAERFRQVREEGYDAAHDDAQEDPGSISRAGCCYGLQAAFQLGGTALIGKPAMLWPWDWKFWKPKDPRKNLVRGAALFIAEIDKLDRASEQAKDASKAKG